MDEEDKEAEYEEKISKEFSELINSFQKNTNMDSTSMIRLLSDQIVKFANKIDVLGK